MQSWIQSYRSILSLLACFVATVFFKCFFELNFDLQQKMASKEEVDELRGKVAVLDQNGKIS
jgi:hypothetical protein